MNRTFKQLKKISNIFSKKKDTRHPDTILTPSEERMDKYAREISRYSTQAIPRALSGRKALKTIEQSREKLAKNLSKPWDNQELKLRNFIVSFEELVKMNSADAVDVFRRIEQIEKNTSTTRIKTRKLAVEFIHSRWTNFAGIIIKTNFMKGRSVS